MSGAAVAPDRAAPAPVPAADAAPGPGDAPLAAAAIYLARGWPPAPIPPGAQGPQLKGWPALRPAPADLSRLVGAPGTWLRRIRARGPRRPPA